jgi:predicted AlkP superfamily pyrophosphatase or phosphodiesterase
VRALLLSLCALCAACAAPPAPLPAAAPGEGVRHVLVVSIDGLRPDHLTPELMPNLVRLREAGVSAAEARTVIPSQTLPSHTSMWTGVSPAVHGIVWNDDRTASYGHVRVETAFEVARRAGLGTAAVAGKSKLRHLFRPGTLDVAMAPRGAEVVGAMEVAAEIHELLRHQRPHLLFAHFADPDIAGHAFGWGGRVYRSALRRSDRALGHLLRAAEAAYGSGLVVIVTADHGGLGHVHDLGREEDVLIPWIAWGAGLPASTLPGPVSTCDTAATALALLGVAVPAAWEGVALLERGNAGAAITSGRASPARRCE